MTIGIATDVANQWLDLIGAPGGPWETVCAKLHTADPGVGGALALSAETTRKPITWDAAVSGAKAMAGSLTWSGWNMGTETITHISLWTALTGGSFMWSGQLSVPKLMTAGDGLSITSLVLRISPLSA